MTDDELPAARAETFGSIFVILQHLARLADAELAPLGITARQWLLLAVLTKGFAGRSPSLSEAAGEYGTSRQNVKQIALGLEARGFVRLVPDRDDARTTRIELTERVGVFDQPETVERQAAVLADAFAGLSAQETLALRDIVRRWLAGIVPYGSARTRP
jgi:DNA-binding MarR family transcriptional regulator